MCLSQQILVRVDLLIVPSTLMQTHCLLDKATNQVMDRIWLEEIPACIRDVILVEKPTLSVD